MHKLLHRAASKRKLLYTRHDIMAALVVTAISIPQSLGFAVIAGLPPITGLYSALLAPIVFGLVAKTRRLVVGADSATAALVASGAVLVAQVGTIGYTNAVAMLGLLVAFVLLLMAALRLGLLADLISRPVLVGFLGGVGVQLIIMNLPGLFGVSLSGSAHDILRSFIEAAGSINGMTATVSLLVIGTIVIMRKSRLPGELVGLVLAGAFVAIFHAHDYGVQLVGALPAGFPALQSVHMSLPMIMTLLPAAVAIALVILAQSSSLIRTTAAEHDEPVSLNRDLVALGIGNATSALTQGFTINGSPPRTLAADAAGGKTAMVNVWMGIFIGVVLLFGAKLFEYVPQAALASIVLVLGFRLIRLGELRHIWYVHRTEFWVAMIALVGTAVFGVLLGVCVAVVVSLTERLIRQYHPKDSILLRDGELSSWAIERIGRDPHTPKDVLVYSFNGSLFFENVQYFTQRLTDAIAHAKEPVHTVIVDAGAIDSIDYTAVSVLESFCRHLSADGISLGFAHVSPNLYDQFERYGITTLVGTSNIFLTLTAAMKVHAASRRAFIERIKDLSLGKNQYVLVGGGVLDVLDLRNATDIDLVVSQETYDSYRVKFGWREFTQTNGKKVLSRDGYNLMTTWVGTSLKQLQSDASTVKGVRVMSVRRLIEGKQQLGRRKDRADIRLLRAYERERQQRATSSPR